MRRLGLLAAIVVVAIAVFAAWYLLIRDNSPPPVDLGAAIASVQTPQPAQATAVPTAAASRAVTASPVATATPTATASSVATATPTAAASSVATANPAATSEAAAAPGGGSPDGDLSGTWVVSEAGESFAGYRIGEELASVGTATAVGRTGDLVGTLEFDGTAITAVELEVDMTTLRSDDSRRDNQLRRRGIETDSFPIATFSLTERIELESVPAEEVPVTTVAVGELTLHGVARTVRVQLAGQLAGGFCVVVGSTEIVLADYDIEPPTGFSVLSIEEVGTMEFQLVFEQASGS